MSTSGKTFKQKKHFVALTNSTKQTRRRRENPTFQLQNGLTRLVAIVVQVSGRHNQLLVGDTGFLISGILNRVGHHLSPISAVFLLLVRMVLILAQFVCDRNRKSLHKRKMSDMTKLSPEENFSSEILSRSYRGGAMALKWPASDTEVLPRNEHQHSKYRHIAHSRARDRHLNREQTVRQSGSLWRSTSVQSRDCKCFSTSLYSLSSAAARRRAPRTASRRPAPAPGGTPGSSSCGTESRCRPGT